MHHCLLPNTRHSANILWFSWLFFISSSSIFNPRPRIFFDCFSERVEWRGAGGRDRERGREGERKRHRERGRETGRQREGETNTDVIETSNGYFRHAPGHRARKRDCNRGSCPWPEFTPSVCEPNRPGLPWFLWTKTLSMAPTDST